MASRMVALGALAAVLLAASSAVAKAPTMAPGEQGWGALHGDRSARARPGPDGPAPC